MLQQIYLNLQSAAAELRATAADLKSAVETGGRYLLLSVLVGAATVIGVTILRSHRGRGDYDTVS